MILSNGRSFLERHILKGIAYNKGMTNNQKCIWSGGGIVAVAAIGSVFTYFGQGWYAGLIKPSQWPPSFLFPIVWSIIYILAFLMFCFLLKGAVWILN